MVKIIILIILLLQVSLSANISNSLGPQNPQITRYRQTINSYFPADKSMMIEGILTKNQAMFFASINGKQGNYIINIGLVLLFGVIFMIVTPILYFCNCCQKRFCCEKKCFSFFVIILLALFLGISITILIKNIYLHNQISGIFDFFNAGINSTFSTENTFLFNDISQKINQSVLSLRENLKKLDSNSNTSKIFVLNDLLNKMVQNVPHIANQNQGPLDLKYLTPLALNSETLILQQSTLVSQLGSKTTQGSRIFNLLHSVSMAKQHLSILAKSKDNIAKKNQNILQVRMTELKKLQRNYNQSQQRTKTKLKEIEKIFIQPQLIIIYSSSSMSIFISTILFVLVLRLCTKFNSIKDSTSLYFCCGIFWFLGLFLFLIAAFFGVMSPIIAYTSQYLDEGLYNQSHFRHIEQYIKEGKSNQIFNDKVTKCYFASKREAIFKYDNESVESYKANFIFNDVLQQSRDILQIVRKNKHSQVIDLRQNSINELKEIAEIRQECLLNDRWVPSLDQNIIPCNNRSEVFSPQICGDSALFRERADGCRGCIDTDSVFSRYLTQQELKADLDIRYPQCIQQNRSEITQKLITLWLRYYSLKDKVLQLVENRSLANYLNAIELNTIYSEFKISYNKVIDISVLRSLKDLSYSKIFQCNALRDRFKSFNKRFSRNFIPYVFEMRILFCCSAFNAFFVVNLLIFYRNSLIQQLRLRQESNRANKNNAFYLESQRRL